MVFCLGVLYHTPDPVGMLRELWGAMAKGAQLIVDCQGVADAPGPWAGQPLALVPAGRYANMGGVWFLPTLAALKNWLRRASFAEVECFYAEPLSTEEQRATEWAPISSLEQALVGEPAAAGPDGAARTVEGYPAPWRFYVKARRV